MGFIEKRPYIGDLSQLFAVKEYRMTGGKSDGVRAVDVKNGAGIDLTILLDRCMDISHLRFKGNNIGYISPCGIVAPTYYSDREFDFLRSFTVGFLTSCGLSAFGTPSTDDGEQFGLHGRIANTPAETVAVSVDEDGDVPVFKVRGTMRQGRIFGEYLTLTREIVCAYGSNKIDITDTVENRSFKKLPHMQLYHCNFGYPLLCEETKLLLPTAGVEARDEHAATGLDRWDKVETPMDDCAEMCYYHDMACDADGATLSGVFNPTLGIGVILRFNKNSLDHFIQWKMMGKGEYVLGLEPGNAKCEGRAEEKKAGRLKYIEPGEKKVNSMTVEFLDGKRDFERVSDEIKTLLNAYKKH